MLFETNSEHAPLVQRLGYEPSKLETRVRLPDGAPTFNIYFYQLQLLQRFLH